MKASSASVSAVISAVALLSYVASGTDVEFKEAKSGVLEIAADGVKELFRSKSAKYKVKTGAIYGFSYKGREVGSGIAVSGSSTVNVDRQGPDAGWYDYSHAYQTADAAGREFDDTFHLGHYRGKGDFSFKDVKFFELQPTYADFGGMKLGHGESIDGSRYRFSASYSSFARNHARPLLMYRRITFNTDRWNIGAGGELAYRHELAGRMFRSGKVFAVSSYFTGKGPLLVEASADGSAWTEIGAITNKCSVAFTVPAKMFPVKRLFVRLRGGEKAGLQISHYAFEGDVDGPSILAFGHTKYHDVKSGALFGEMKAPIFAEPISSSNAQRLAADPAAVVWGSAADVKVFRTTPVPTVSAKALKLSLAGNEAESVQLVVAPREGVSDVRVSATDLVLKSYGMIERFRIPASSVKVERLAYVNVQIPTDETGACGDWPDPILPQDATPFPVKAGVNQPFWITVKTPKHIPKGVYKGTLTVCLIYAKGRGARKVSVPFEVEVFGFDLPDRMTCETAYGFSTERVADFHAVKPRSREHDQVLEKYVQMLADHHISLYNWGNGTGPKVNWENSGNPAKAVPVFDWEEFDDAHIELAGRFHVNTFRIPVAGLGHGFQQGFSMGKICGVYQTNDLYHTLMSRYLGGVERHLREKGWLGMSYVYWFDEPLRSVYPQVNAGMATLKRHAPGLRRMLTDSPSKELWEGVNLWNPRLDTIYSIDYADVRARGDQFWWYICCGPKAPYPTEFIDHYGCELRTWLWMTWARNITGVLVWETTLWTSKSRYPDANRPQNPYVDAMSWSSSGGTWGNGDGRFVYPPLSTVVTPRKKDRKPVLEGPNSSYRLAILRDGIEDYEYFALLKKADPSNPLLKVPESVFRNERDFSPDPSFMREHRAKLAREIERLKCGAPYSPPVTCVAAKPVAAEGFRIMESPAGLVAVNNFDDTIQEALYRVKGGELNSMKAKAVALVLGTNNRGCTPEDMAAGMRAVVAEIRRRRPDMKVLLYASFPCRRTWSNLRNRAANELYAKLADGGNVEFRDVNAELSLSMFPDGLHPDGKAISVLLDDIAKCIR